MRKTKGWPVKTATDSCVDTAARTNQKRQAGNEMHAVSFLNLRQEFPLIWLLVSHTIKIGEGLYNVHAPTKTRAKFKNFIN